MQDVFLTRAVYNHLVTWWKSNHASYSAFTAYFSARREWSLAGVRVWTDDAALLALVRSVEVK